MVSSELLGVVRAYVEGQLKLHELEEWVVPRLPDFFHLPHAPDAELVSAIELGLAEISAGDVSESEFRSGLRHRMLEYRTEKTFYAPDLPNRNESSQTETGGSNEASAATRSPTEAPLEVVWGPS